jgi:hypothetical protein
MNRVAASPGPFIARGSHWHLTGSGRVLGGKGSRDRQSSALGLGLPQPDLNEVAYGHGCCGRVILWSSGSPVQSGIPRAESHQPSCKSLIAKGTGSSSIAGRIGHLLQVAPIESAAARIFFRRARISARGTPDRALTTCREFGRPRQRNGQNNRPLHQFPDTPRCAPG